MVKIDKERLEHIAAVYSNNTYASEALEISIGAFSRLCRKYGIEIPC